MTDVGQVLTVFYLVGVASLAPVLLELRKHSAILTDNVNAETASTDLDAKDALSVITDTRGANPALVTATAPNYATAFLASATKTDSVLAR